MSYHEKRTPNTLQALVTDGFKGVLPPLTKKKSNTKKILDAATEIPTEEYHDRGHQNEITKNVMLRRPAE